MANIYLKRNTFMNIVNVAISSIVSFFLRTYLNKYIGVELLGVNATIVDTINLLNITELGIQTSITYQMYSAIGSNDIYRQRELFSLYRKAYFIVGITILTIGLMISPFLKTIVNTTVSMTIVYSIFFLSLGGSVIRYFISYYKLLYIAHEKQYICIQIDTAFSFISTPFGFLILIFTKNYVLYVLINTIMSLLCQLIIVAKAKKDYPEIVKKTDVKNNDVNKLFYDMKQMLIGTISGYAYGSTDNVLISWMFGSVYTGLVSNYKYVTNLFRTLLSSLITSVSPTWGNFLYRKNSTEENIYNYYTYSIFTMYLILIILFVPTYCLIDDFVVIWLGKEFIIDKIIVILIIADIFCNYLNEPTCILIRNLGLFKEEKNISLIAASVNVVFSLIFSYFFGIKGIFMGTLVAVFVYWVGRSYVINLVSFKNDSKKYSNFWFNNLVYVLSFCLLCFVCEKVVLLMEINNKYFEFLLKGFIIEIIIGLYILIFWRRTDRFKFVIEKVGIKKKW